MLHSNCKKERKKVVSTQTSEIWLVPIFGAVLCMCTYNKQCADYSKIQHLVLVYRLNVYIVLLYSIYMLHSMHTSYLIIVVSSAIPKPVP